MTQPLTDRERALCREAAELPEVEHNGCRYRYNPEAHYYEYLDPDCGWRCLWTDPALVRALAPLLPKRELTDEIVRKAFEAWRWTPAERGPIRAALLAVWDDIAGPVAPAPAPQWWGVVNNDGRMYSCDSLAGGHHLIALWDHQYPAHAPHRVVALAEVPHAP